MQARNFRHALNFVHQHGNTNLPQHQNQCGTHYPQSEMRTCVDHIVGPVSAFDGVAHFRNFLLLNLQGSTETIRAANFLYRIRGNGKKLIRHVEENHRFRLACFSRFDRVLSCNFYCAPTGISLANLTTRLSMVAPISLRSTTSSTAPVLMASAGMPKITEEASSCAIT